MFWLFSAVQRLQQRGILGINQRNAAFIMGNNPQSRFPLVDDKLQTHDLCQAINVPTPRIYKVFTQHGELRQIEHHLKDLHDFVIKPNRGAGGRGISVITGRDGGSFFLPNGSSIAFEEISRHISDILSGMYSLGGVADRAIVQHRIRLHPAFKAITYKGIPDIRVVLFRHEPAMAMLRLPTSVSRGRANLHQGGLGVGIDLDTGITSHAVLHNRVEEWHPDTGIAVVGLRVPYWSQIVDLSRRVSEAAGLGYIGVDIVVDAEEGPLLLEANARPGLAIQIANARGLLPRLEEIDRTSHRQIRRSVGSPGD